MARKQPTPDDYEDDVNPLIGPRSQRSLAEACALAGIPLPPATPLHHGEVYLRLLVAGVDHDAVGRDLWVDVCCFGAPREGGLGVWCVYCKEPVMAPPARWCPRRQEHAALDVGQPPADMSG